MNLETRAAFLISAGVTDTFGSILGAQFVAVVQYWVGSSAGSKKKDDQIAALQAPRP